MDQNKDIQKIAKAVLSESAPDGQPDNWLWDSAKRIERNVNLICKSDELQRANIPIDLFCLKGAVYFCQAGLTICNNTTENDTQEITRLSTSLVAENLNAIIDTKRIEKIKNIITQAPEKNTRLNEAKILSDAINLEDIGAVGIFNQTRTAAKQKKSISQLVGTFNKKADYGYWQARLNESFHFKTTENIAKKRFAIMNIFMQNLDNENKAQI